MIATQPGYVRHDPTAVPVDYAELFEQYYNFVLGMARRFGISPEEAPDVVQEIYLRIMERDILRTGALNTDEEEVNLKGFDPGNTVVHGGREYQARFKSWFASIVVAYLRGKAQARFREASRTKAILNAPITSNLEGGAMKEAAESYAQELGLVEYPDYVDLEEEDLVRVIGEHLIKIPRRSDQDVMDLPRLFKLIVAQVHETGEVNRKALAQEFGVSVTAIGSWIGYLRTYVREVLAKADS